MKKPVSQATRAMLDAMDTDAAKPASPDKLEACRVKVAEMRDKQKEVADLAERTKELNKEIAQIRDHDLVGLFDEAKIDRLGLPPEGNQPAYEVELEEYFHANIPKENERGAYEWMKKTKNEDMIKTSYTIEFGLGESKDCTKFEKMLDKYGCGYDKKQGVPWNTLTSFIRGEFRAKRPLTAKVMGLLGAEHFRRAKVVTQKKEKK